MPLLKCLTKSQVTFVMEEVHKGIYSFHSGGKTMMSRLLRGVDILGPFVVVEGQVKFFLIGIDYFSKWIEVESLVIITTQKIQKFVWKNVICRQ
ncbi:hypothetical protein CR513_18748, partial [Mucuna pruriens]